MNVNEINHHFSFLASFLEVVGKGGANPDLCNQDSPTTIGSSNRDDYRLRVPHHEQHQSSEQAGNRP